MLNSSSLSKSLVLDGCDPEGLQMDKATSKFFLSVYCVLSAVF